MTINEYQKAALRTATEDCPNGRLMNAVLGLCGECGEVADIVKKFMYQGHELSRERIAEEIGDCAWYIALAANALALDLETVLQMNIDKLKRRYPDGFSVERSIHREE